MKPPNSNCWCWRFAFLSLKGAKCQWTSGRSTNGKSRLFRGYPIKSMDITAFVWDILLGILIGISPTFRCPCQYPYQYPLFGISPMISYNQCTGCPLYATRISHTILLWRISNQISFVGVRGCPWHMCANILCGISMRISHRFFCFQGCASWLTRDTSSVSHRISNGIFRAISTTVTLRHCMEYPMFVEEIS